MRKKRFSRTHPRTSTLSHGWQNLRFHWYTTRKGPLIFILVIGLVVTSFGYFIHSAFARRDDVKNLTCLAFNVYFEARGEPMVGQYAVAEVTMNRVASGRYPDTICGVVHQRNWDTLRKRYVGAFSWNELDERPSLEEETFRRAWEVAETVYYGRHTPTLAGALHYHATHIKPSWARGNKPVARIGRHIFYR
ncbi:cell wall hydrolase [Sulfuricaulis sp.]|uniref:cell wall hydrolase n=1 Tax=Sulfuricaulis sp. TaxID=2003553 RepID=UPI0025D0B939|nr:cell wall hydrolase [Sulfuricaulis sp.]